MNSPAAPPKPAGDARPNPDIVFGRLLGVSSRTLLPGHEALEAKLNLAAAELEEIGALARQSQSLRQIPALEPPVFASYLRELRGPLDDRQASAIAHRLDQAFKHLDEIQRLAREERAVFDQLCDPRSPNCIFKSDDYYGVITYTALRSRKTA